MMGSGEGSTASFLPSCPPASGYTSSWPNPAEAQWRGSLREAAVRGQPSLRKAGQRQVQSAEPEARCSGQSPTRALLGNSVFKGRRLPGFFPSPNRSPAWGKNVLPLRPSRDSSGSPSNIEPPHHGATRRTVCASPQSNTEDCPQVMVMRSGPLGGDQTWGCGGSSGQGSVASVTKLPLPLVCVPFTLTPSPHPPLVTPDACFPHTQQFCGTSWLSYNWAQF